MAITLYHFTTPEQWASIDVEGALTPHWQRNPEAEKTVHLSASDDLNVLPWGIREGRTVRIKVELPESDVHDWHTWGKQWVFPEEWQSLGIPVLTPDGPYVSQWNEGSHLWRVVQRPIRRAEWVEVVDLAQGSSLWAPMTG